MTTNTEEQLREALERVRGSLEFGSITGWTPEQAKGGEDVAGELDPRRSYEFGQLITKYSESFNGQNWDSVCDSVDRKNLAVALDHLTEAGAMLMNISERLLRTHPTPAASVTDEQIAACVKRASTYGLPFVGLLNPGGTPSDFSKRFTAEILALRPAQAADQWREAVEEEFALNHIAMPEDPREAIKKLIATEVRDALDPSISSAAAALVQAGVTDDIVKDAQRYRWLRRKACVIGKTTYCGEETGQPILDFANLPDVTEVISRDSATTLDAAIDAAMLAAAPKEGGAV